MMTAPHEKASNGAPLFQRGCGSSDVLHEILKEVPSIEHLFGHSKGALVIQNAILGLPEAVIDRLRIVTFGCTISSAIPPAQCLQFLGTLDWLGWLNSAGNLPNKPIETGHSTNAWIPLSMHVTDLARSARAT